MPLSAIDRLFTGILLAGLTILGIGVVMVSSASMALSDYHHGSMHYHSAAHLTRLGVGAAAAVAVYCVGARALKKFSPSLMLLGLALTAFILVPGFAVDVNNATRWLKIGALAFQPYDLFKLGFIVFFAHALERCGQDRGFIELKAPLLVLLTASVLLLSQPDFGSFSLLVGIALLTLFVVKGASKALWLSAATATATIAALIASSPYRMQRIESLFDPWADRHGTGYQLVQALLAEGGGGVGGVGLGQSVQKMLYLPEAHTDFSISVFAEEAGAIGVFLVLGLIVYMYMQLTRLSFILRRHGFMFECYLVFLVAHFIFIQSLLNIGVNYGLLPTKGITLPFMGYGGTSVVSHMIMLGMVMATGRGLRRKLGGLPQPSLRAAGPARPLSALPERRESGA